MNSTKVIRVAVGVGCVAALLLIFLFQKTDVAKALGIDSGKTASFIFNRSVRFILNDIFAIGLIFALFYKRKFVWFAFIVQIAGMIFFLAPYFTIKIYYPNYNGPLLNFLHRLILNPTIMLLLIPAFYYQTYVKGMKVDRSSKDAHAE